MRNRQSEEEIEEEIKQNNLDRKKYRVGEYAKSVVSGLVQNNKQYEKRGFDSLFIAQSAFAIAEQMYKLEQELT